MKAAVWTRYGPPEVLQVREVATPVPKADEILVRIAAANVFPGDCELRRFQVQGLFWIPVRLYVGILRPRLRILGQELTGEVVATGRDVTRFQVGDRILSPTSFGGAHAEFVAMRTGIAALKPANLTDEEAAAVCVGGLNALHFLRTANVQSGHRIVIHGAGGSIGTMAVQIAKALGAHVTAVDFAFKLDALRAIGADRTVDPTQENVFAAGEHYDAIIDVAGKSPFSKSLSALVPDGRYVLGNASTWAMARRLLASFTSSRRVRVALTAYRAEDLRYLLDLIEAGHVRPVVDRTFPLADVVAAHRYVESGQKIGNVVLTLS